MGLHTGRGRAKRPIIILHAICNERCAAVTGLRTCPGSVPLWRSVARLEEVAGNVGKARALLEQVRPLSLSSHFFDKFTGVHLHSYSYKAPVFLK